MLAREQARRPPPPPEEVRRQLGWRLAPPPCSALVGLYLLPATLGQLAAQSMLDWCMLPLRAQIGSGARPN